MISDSGNRTEYGNGFVRDESQGKGRLDLCPWFAIMELSCHCEEGALKYGERNIDKGAPLHSLINSGLRHIGRFVEGVDDGEDHLRAACWNFMWALNQRFTHPECNDLPWAASQDSFQFLQDSTFVRDMAKCRVYVPVDGESASCVEDAPCDEDACCGCCAAVIGPGETVVVDSGESSEGETECPDVPITRY